MPKSVWIFAKADSPEAQNVASWLKKHLQKSGTSLDENFDLNSTGLVIVLGGDGTLLANLRDLGEARFEVPFLGIHQSPGLGFLHPIAAPKTEQQAAVWVAKVCECVQKVLNDPAVSTSSLYRIRERWGLEAQVRGRTSTIWSLNDIVVSKGTLSRMVYLRVRVDDTILWDNIRGDGLIIASAVGSTAYSLSAGGPVVHPDTAALLLTPICPHEMAQRPVVLGGSARVSVEVIPGYVDAWLTQDGQTGEEISAGSVIEIHKSKKSIKTLVPLDPALESKNFYERLRFKLGLGGRRAN